MDYKIDWNDLIKCANEYAAAELARKYHDEYIRYYNEYLESAKSDISAIIARDLQSKIAHIDGTVETPLPKSWKRG